MNTFFQAVESIAIISMLTDTAEASILVVNAVGFTVTGCGSNRTCVYYGGLTCKITVTQIFICLTT